MVNQQYCVPGTTCNKIPLEQRKIWKKTISSTIVLFILVLFIVFWSSNMFSDASRTAFAGSLFVVIFIAVFIMTLVYQYYYYRNYFYDLKKDEVIIKKGVISRIEISLAYEKIQNVYVDQDIIDRIFQLYDVHLETAGGQSGVIAHIDGVNAENSKKLRDMFMVSLKKYSRKRSI